MVSSGGRAAFAALVVVAALGGAAAAQEAPGGEPEPAPLEGATIDDAGWWNRTRPQVSLPTGPVPAPPTPGVPAGSLVVAASAGEPDAVTAIAVDPEHRPGATVESFELLLREVADEGANLNTSFAAIVACPATSYWIGGENGVWDTRPEFDCSLGEAPGTRADDGSWTFDLTAIGQLWSDGTLEENGVVLVEAVDPPTAFRIAFAGLADQAVGARVVATGGDEPDDPFGGGTGSSGGGNFGGGSTGSSGGGFRPPANTPGAPATTATTVPPGTGATDGDGETAVPTVPISGPGSPLGTLPWWTWPLLLVLVAFALVAMVALGPLGEPALAGTRGRGVTRAIESRLHSEDLP